MRTELTLDMRATKLLDLGRFDGIYGGGPVTDPTPGPGIITRGF